MHNEYHGLTKLILRFWSNHFKRTSEYLARSAGKVNACRLNNAKQAYQTLRGQYRRYGAPGSESAVRHGDFRRGDWGDAARSDVRAVHLRTGT